MYVVLSQTLVIMSGNVNLLSSICHRTTQFQTRGLNGAPINHLVQHMESQGGSVRAGGSGPYPVRF